MLRQLKSEIAFQCLHYLLKIFGFCPNRFCSQVLLIFLMISNQFCFLFRLMLGLLRFNLMASILHHKSFVEYYFVRFIYKIYKDFQHRLGSSSFDLLTSWITLIIFSLVLVYSLFESNLNPKL